MKYVKSANFLYSRTVLQSSTVCEVCLCGRSNAGKSSLINMLANQKKLAKTSSEPGRTRLINYFEFLLQDEQNVQKKLHLVDLPGYGYSKVDKTKQNSWDEMIDNYIKNSASLCLCICIVDSRIELQKSDLELIKYLYTLGLPFLIVGAKIDKVAKYQRQKIVQNFSTAFKVGRDDIILCSSVDSTGKQDLVDKLYTTAEGYQKIKID